MFSVKYATWIGFFQAYVRPSQKTNPLICQQSQITKHDV